MSGLIWIRDNSCDNFIHGHVYSIWVVLSAHSLSEPAENSKTFVLGLGEKESKIEITAKLFA